MTMFVQLVGPPACGKRTIGALLAQHTGAALIDNHLINDPVFTALGANGIGKLPATAFPLAKRVAEVVYEAVLAAPPELGHIFTKFWVDEPGDAAQEVQMRALAERRGVPFYPVWLTCDVTELRRRVTLPERRTRNKMRDPDALSEFIRTPLLPVPDDALQLDTTTTDAADAANQILAWIDARR